MRAKTATILKIATDAHSTVVGGSTAKLRRLCPRSIDEEMKVPKEPSGYAADRGTALHHVCELAVRGSWSDERVLREFTGVHLQLDHMDHEVVLTEQLLRAKALPALAIVDRIIHVDAEVWFEKKMPFPGIPNAFGTSDLVFDQTFLEPHELEGNEFVNEAGILDYKFGDGWIVSAEDNDQMRFYLCSAIAEELLPELPQYTAYIVQPAEKLPEERYVSRGVYTAEDLRAFAEDLIDAVASWRDGSAVHVTGEHCNTCRGKVACGPYKRMLAAGMASDINGMSTRELAEWLDKLAGISAFSKQIYAAALRNAQLGKIVPGWKTATGEGDRRWKDVDAALAALGRLNVPTEVRTTRVPISAPQALAYLKEIQAPADKVKAFEKKHIERPTTGERLVRLEKGEKQEAPKVPDKLAALYNKHKTRK